LNLYRKAICFQRTCLEAGESAAEAAHAAHALHLLGHAGAGELLHELSHLLKGLQQLVDFLNLHTGGGNVYRHPSQLYEALLEGLVIFVVLFALSRKRPPRPQGTFIGGFLVMYGIFRFLVEFVRLPDEQVGYLLGTNWLTMGQCLSIPLVLLGVGVLVVAHRLGRPQEGYLA
jgi:prolipoprotein diacylglyceryltransferase